MAKSKCDIIIPVHDQPELTKACLDSIFANTSGTYRIIVIDNASSPQTAMVLKNIAAGHGEVSIVTNKENAGWVKSINQGLAVSEAGYICFMNNDTMVRTPDWLNKLMETCDSDASIGIANPVFDIKVPESKKAYIEVDFCRGYCMLIKRDVVDRIGVLDEAYGMGYYDDDDYSVRAIKAGFKCVRVNNVFVEHLRDSTFSAVFAPDKMRELHAKNKELFYSKWGRRLNILFILTGSPDIRKIYGIFMDLVRRQHIVYVWSCIKLPEPDHINIRIKHYPFIFKPLFGLMVLFNSMKKSAKRYRLVIRSDSGHIDRQEILNRADSLSRIEE